MVSCGAKATARREFNHKTIRKLRFPPGGRIAGRTQPPAPALGVLALAVQMLLREKEQGRIPDVL
jgi:hypothetical protein